MPNAIRRLCATCIVPLLALAACETQRSGIRVDLRTDWVPGWHFDTVRTSLEDTAVVAERALADDDDALDGLRVAEFDGLPTDSYVVVVELFAGDRLVARRRVRAALRARAAQLVSVLITRSCEGVMCPSGDPMRTECVGGRCDSIDCGQPGAPECSAAQCASDGDCAPGAACGAGRCVDGLCVVETEGVCAAGEVCDPAVGCVPSLSNGCIDGVVQTLTGPLRAADGDGAGLAIVHGQGEITLLDGRGGSPRAVVAPWWIEDVASANVVAFADRFELVWVSEAYTGWLLQWAASLPRASTTPADGEELTPTGTHSFSVQYTKRGSELVTAAKLDIPGTGEYRWNFGRWDSAYRLLATGSYARDLQNPTQIVPEPAGFLLMFDSGELRAYASNFASQSIRDRFTAATRLVRASDAEPAALVPTSAGIEVWSIGGAGRSGPPINVGTGARTRSPDGLGIARRRRIVWVENERELRYTRLWGGAALAGELVLDGVAGAPILLEGELGPLIVTQRIDGSVAVVQTCDRPAR